jgi:hypothetical protein
MRAHVRARSASYLWLAGLGALLLAVPSAVAQPRDPVVERVLADWQKRQKRVQRVRYVVTGQSIIPKGSLDDPITGLPLNPPEPAQDVAQPQKSDLLLDFEGQRFRLELSEQVYYQSKKQLVPRAKITVFDGKSLSTLCPREANATDFASEPSMPDICILKGSSPTQDIRPLRSVNAYYLSPLFLAHGIVAQLTDQPAFGRTPDPEDLVVHGRGVYAGRACLVLRTLPIKTMAGATFEEYWIDTAKESAVLRQASYLEGVLTVDLAITYQETSYGSLPLTWVGITRKAPDKIVNVTRLRVQELSADPPLTNADFEVEARPGMNILEDTLDVPGKVDNAPGFERTYYHVGEDGRWNPVVGGVVGKLPWWRWYYLAVPALAAGVGLVLWRLLRRRRQARTGPSVSGGAR